MAHPVRRRHRLAARLGALLPQLGDDVAEAVGAEQPLEDLASRVGVGPQERGELALGQHHQRRELLGAQADQVVDQRSGLVQAGGARHPVPAEEFLDEDARLHGGGALAAPLGPLPLR
ncbi:MAG: hypothetical protein U0Q15_13540 [Kineosporiaceae bacterium]